MLSWWNPVPFFFCWIVQMSGKFAAPTSPKREQNEIRCLWNIILLIPVKTETAALLCEVKTKSLNFIYPAGTWTHPHRIGIKINKLELISSIFAFIRFVNIIVLWTNSHSLFIINCSNNWFLNFSSNAKKNSPAAAHQYVTYPHFESVLLMLVRHYLICLFTHEMSARLHY